MRSAHCDLALAVEDREAEEEAQEAGPDSSDKPTTFTWQVGKNMEEQKETPKG